VKTSERPELRETVLAFAARLIAGDKTIPLADLAALFGADESDRARVATRGDLVLANGRITNDGPELVVEAGRIELEIPSLLRGDVTSDDEGFRLVFPLGEFSVRACVTIAILRKCFELKELRATCSDLVLDFGNDLADRRYTF